MEKTAELNLCVNAFAKRKAEVVLDKLGISMSNAVDRYLYKIALTGDLSFLGDLPMAPPSLNMDLMTDEELWEKLKKGVEDIKEGRYESLDEAFAKHEEKYKQ